MPMLNVRLSDDDWAALNAAVAEAGVDRSTFVRAKLLDRVNGTKLLGPKDLPDPDVVTLPNRHPNTRPARRGIVVAKRSNDVTPIFKDRDKR